MREQQVVDHLPPVSIPYFIDRNIGRIKGFGGGHVVTHRDARLVTAKKLQVIADGGAVAGL